MVKWMTWITSSSWQMVVGAREHFVLKVDVRGRKNGQEDQVISKPAALLPGLQGSVFFKVAGWFVQHVPLLVTCWYHSTWLFWQAKEDQQNTITSDHKLKPDQWGNLTSSSNFQLLLQQKYYHERFLLQCPPNSTEAGGHHNPSVCMHRAIIQPLSEIIRLHLVLVSKT